MGRKSSELVVLFGGVLLMMMVMVMEVRGDHDYGEALSKCILFFEGQRSGKLPTNQRITWRKDSALKDGSDIGMDLEGGYYDAGDNVKFHFPMAFTTTMIAWSILEFGNHMRSEKTNAIEALKWGTDYLLKVTNNPNQIVAQVGDPEKDHDCWERPEDMDTARTSYVINATHPGTEVAAEIAAALAASSLVFKDKHSDDYSKLLINRAVQVFEFADQYRGNYNFSLRDAVCPFYCDVSGYMDDLLWGASWLYKATNDKKYWNYITQNIEYLETGTSYGKVEGKDPGHVGGSYTEFGWDTKHAGVNVLISRRLMRAPDSSYPFVKSADKFICSLLPESPSKFVSYTPGGLLMKPGGSNTQHATALSFLALVYSRYMFRAHNRTIDCGNNVIVSTSRLTKWVKTQVDYILGDNPLKMSYMVGYSNRFPTKIHHRGSTLPSIDHYKQRIKCRDGDKYFFSPDPNPNELTGAIVGGPDANDNFSNSRLVIEQTEPTTYINAPFVGVLGFFKAFPNLH